MLLNFLLPKHSGKRLALLLLSVLLCALLCACAGTSQTSESPSTSPSPSPSMTGAPEPTPRPESESSPEEEAGVSENHSGMLPAPEVGSREFVEEFLLNPIDAQFEEGMSLASSVAEMLEVCTDVSEKWNAQIDSMYTQLVAEDADPEVAERITESQAKWLSEQEDALAEIREAVDENDSMSPLSAAENVMLYYRARAIELCAEFYAQTGSLSFG